MTRPALPTAVATPVRLAVDPGGDLTGATGRYEKRIGDLAGVYRDDEAYTAAVQAVGADHVAYHVHEQRYDSGPGSLIVGTSTLQPGQVGEEFAVTRGHLHAVSDRAELYHCLSGHGVMLLETVDGESVAVELHPGEAINVPGEWIHRSVNVGAEPFVTLFCYNADAGQDYDLISRAGGMRSLIVRDGEGWRQVDNPDHGGYRKEAAS